jgi:hypothetical protein
MTGWPLNQAIAAGKQNIENDASLRYRNPHAILTP